MLANQVLEASGKDDRTNRFQNDMMSLLDDYISECWDRSRRSEKKSYERSKRKETKAAAAGHDVLILYESNASLGGYTLVNFPTQISSNEKL